MARLSDWCKRNALISVNENAPYANRSDGGASDYGISLTS
jgi:hypothetical protein